MKHLSPKRKLRETFDKSLFTKQNLFYHNIRRNKDSDLITISLEEYAALRLYYYKLKDIKKSKQELCAKEFNVSQPTFSRILKNGSEKLVQAIVEEKNFQIADGNIGYKKIVGWGCWDCDWETENSKITKKPNNCPKCKSSKLFKLKKIVAKWSD